MNPRELIKFLNKIEKLKCNTRHSWTSNGRQESVADHSWRLAVMAMLCADEYPELDINKVIKMCLIHDLGEAVTGDIPAFNKTSQHETDEVSAVKSLFAELPPQTKLEFQELYDELSEKKTTEAKLYKALDNLEGLISHNEADISTWLPLEYELNLTYGKENCQWSEWTEKLRTEVNKDSLKKIEENKKD